MEKGEPKQTKAFGQANKKAPGNVHAVKSQHRLNNAALTFTDKVKDVSTHTRPTL